MNYCNRSGQTGAVLNELLPNLAAAISTSCSVALAAKYAVSKMNARTPFGVALATGVVPFLGSAAAGGLNVFLTRQLEWDEGVAV